LCSKEKDIKKVKNVYSQTPALEQCHNYLKTKHIKTHSYSDTALAAKYISESDDEAIAAICSEEAAHLH
jgi:chorismate mutase / prephenate dehydratase